MIKGVLRDSQSCRRFRWWLWHWLKTTWFQGPRLNLVPDRCSSFAGSRKTLHCCQRQLQIRESHEGQWKARKGQHLESVDVGYFQIFQRWWMWRCKFPASTTVSGGRLILRGKGISRLKSQLSLNSMTLLMVCHVYVKSRCLYAAKAVSQRGKGSCIKWHKKRLYKSMVKTFDQNCNEASLEVAESSETVCVTLYIYIITKIYVYLCIYIYICTHCIMLYIIRYTRKSQRCFIQEDGHGKTSWTHPVPTPVRPDPMILPKKSKLYETGEIQRWITFNQWASRWKQGIFHIIYQCWNFAMLDCHRCFIDGMFLLYPSLLFKNRKWQLGCHPLIKPGLVGGNKDQLVKVTMANFVSCGWSSTSHFSGSMIYSAKNESKKKSGHVWIVEPITITWALGLPGRWCWTRSVGLRRCPRCTAPPDVQRENYPSFEDYDGALIPGCALHLIGGLYMFYSLWLTYNLLRILIQLGIFRVIWNTFLGMTHSNWPRKPRWSFNHPTWVDLRSSKSAARLDSEIIHCGEQKKL